MSSITFSSQDWEKICKAFNLTTEKVFDYLNNLNKIRPILLKMDKGEPRTTKISELGNRFCNMIDSHTILLTGEEDGRLESLRCEDEVTNCLRESFSDITFLEKTGNREFGDITVLLEGIEYPINIKMVDPSKSSTFNGGGPKTINYVLFGGGNTNWKSLANKIVTQKPQKCAKEYYYLIYYKNSPRKSVFCSLSDIDHGSIVTNPSNPIQLKKNITIVQRTEQEKAEFIINLFRECAKKRAQAYLILMDIDL